MELLPPGGARTRHVGRSEIMFPQFWLLPFAHALDDVPPRVYALAPWAYLRRDLVR